MSLLAGRLGLATARVPHVDRHGLIWLEREASVVMVWADPQMPGGQSVWVLGAPLVE